MGKDFEHNKRAANMSLVFGPQSYPHQHPTPKKRLTFLDLNMLFCPLL